MHCLLRFGRLETRSSLVDISMVEYLIMLELQPCVKIITLLASNPEWTITAIIIPSLTADKETSISTPTIYSLAGRQDGNGSLKSSQLRKCSRIIPTHTSAKLNIIIL